MLEPRYVDSRETLTRRNFLKRAGFIQKQLDAGDVAFPEYSGEIVLIEHKPVSKYLEDMANGVLVSQARRLAEQSPFPIIMLEGRWVQSDGILLGSRYTWEQAWNQMQSLQDIGLRIQMTTSEEHSLRRILELADYYGDAAYHPSVSRHPAGNLQVAALALIYGVDRAKAEALLQYFGSLADIATATPGELTDAPGIGPVLSSRVAEFFSDVASGGSSAIKRTARESSSTSYNSVATASFGAQP